jgi:hypothetical protein
MRKNFISESEVKEILSMHKSLKEQDEKKLSTDVTSDLVKLRKAIEAGCLKNGKLLTNANQTKYVYRATTKSGKTVDFTADMNYAFGDGSKTGKWKCDKIAQMAAADAKTAQELAAAAADTTLVQQEGGWQEAKNIKTTRENLENPLMFEKKVVNGVTLYRSIPEKGITGGQTEDQKKIIEKWTNKGAKLRKDLDPEEAKTWTSRVVSPASEGYFSQDLIMFFPPENVIGSQGGNLEKEFNKAITNQTPASKKDCKNTIEAYYKAFKTKKRIEPNTFEPMKEKVQACVNEYDGKWGGILSSIDEYVDILRGVKDGGPSSYGADSKWRLQ